MRVAFLGPAGTFSEDALRVAAAEAPTSSPGRRPTVYDAIRAVAQGEADRALVPFENSIEGSVRSDSRHARVRGLRGHDRRRARPPDSPQPDRPRPIELERDRGGPLPPAGQRPVRALHPRGAAAAPRCGPRRARPRRCARSPPVRRALGRARGRVGGADLRLRGPAGGRRGRRPTTSPASSGSPPPGPRPPGDGPWRTTLVFSELGADHPGALVEALTGVLQPRGEPDPDRVAAAAPGARPLHVLLRPRRAGRGRRPVAEAIEALRGKAEIGADPRQLPDRGERDPGDLGDWAR